MIQCIANLADRTELARFWVDEIPGVGDQIWLRGDNVDVNTIAGRGPFVVRAIAHWINATGTENTIQTVCLLVSAVKEKGQKKREALKPPAENESPEDDVTTGV
jgi:hypothetical protein